MKETPLCFAREEAAVRAGDLGKTMGSGDQGVWVIDPDEHALLQLSTLLSSNGFQVTAFDDSRSFFNRYVSGAAACVILEQDLADNDGLSVQRELASQGDLVPIIFLTELADVPTAVQAMKGGAADFLLKPLEADALLSAVKAAIARARRYRAMQTAASVMRRVQALTTREREVMELVIAGLSTKQISVQLGRVDKTVEFHRQNIMKKLGVNNVAQLVRMVTTADHALSQRGNGSAGTTAHRNGRTTH
jgi:FixJ family two-component response regulator